MRSEFEKRQLAVSRREFLAVLAIASGGTGLVPRPTASSAVAPRDDPNVRVDATKIDNGAGGLASYLALPAAPGQVASLIVAHDALGLTPHFEGVARRLAAEGFAALAPDFASRYGGTPAEPGPAHEVVGMTTWDEWLGDTRAAFGWLTNQPHSNGKVAAIGFGLGGSALGRIVFELTDLTSAVLFYGRAPPPENVRRIDTRLLLNYAADDPLVNPQVGAFKKALTEANIDYRAFSYEGAKHGFEDDTAPGAYSPEAAELAWARTIEFLKRTTA